jgi:hypothetical protein
MLAELDTTLLGIIAALIAGQTFILKWLMARSDRVVDSLGDAVASFKSFEKEEVTIHANIVETQLEIIRLLKEIRPPSLP